MNTRASAANLYRVDSLEEILALYYGRIWAYIWWLLALWIEKVSVDSFRTNNGLAASLHLHITDDG